MSRIIGVGYIRVSSKAQVEEGVSLEVQAVRVTELLRKHGCEIIKIFRDEGISGRSIEKRDGIQEAIQYAIDSRSNYFGVYDPSRIARNTSDALAIFTTLKNYNIRIVSNTMAFEDTPIGKFMYTIVSAEAQMRSDQDGEKIKDSKRALRAKGCFLSGAPIGYKNIKDDDKKAWIVPHPKFAQIIIKGLKKFADHELHTQKALAEFYTDEGLDYKHKRRKQGAPIRSQYVNKILRHNLPMYAGYHKFDISTRLLSEPHPYDRLISEELFFKIVDRLYPSVQNNVKHKVLSESFPLRQFLKCKKCGSTIRGYSHTNGKNRKVTHKFYRYGCQTKSCIPSIQNECMHELFKDHLKNFMIDNSKIKLFREIFLRSFRNKEIEINKKKGKLEIELENQKQELENTYVILEKLSEPLVIKRIENKILSITATISRLEADISNELVDFDCEPLVNNAVKYLKNPQQIWEKLQIKGKISYQKWLFPNSLTYCPQNGLRTTQLCSTYEFLTQSNIVNPLNC